MSAKLVSMHKNNSATDKKLMSLVAQFYMKLPKEVIENAIENLSRDPKRKVKKEKQSEKRILTALNMAANQFADEIYQYQRGSILFPQNASYEEILESYNGENCIMNTVLILKKCCDGSYNQKIMADFLKSDEFAKTLMDNYDNYEEDTENDNISDDTRLFVTQEEPEEQIYITEDNTESSEILTMPEIPDEIPDIPEETFLQIPESIPEKSEITPSRKKTKEKEKTVSYYIGHIERRETYYNFAPQYKLEVGTSSKKLIELHQVTETFPPNGTVNLSYVRYESSQRAVINLDLKHTFAIPLDLENLEENIDINTGKMHNDVNFKIDLQKEFDTNRNSTTFFKKISDLRVFRIAEPEDIIPDSELFRESIEISDDFALGELVLLRRRTSAVEDSDYEDISGPYKVDKKDGRTYIQPKIEKQGYLLNCYAEKGLDFGMSERQEFGCDPVCIPFVVIKDSANYKKDIISDEILIRNMFVETSKDFFNIIRKKPDEFVELLGKSVFLAGTLPEDIKKSRLARIRSLFSDIQNYTAEQRKIAETFLRAYSSDNEVHEILSDVIKSSQEFKDMQKELEKKIKAAKPAKVETKPVVDSAKSKKLAGINAEIEELERKIAVLQEKYEEYVNYDNITQEIKSQERIREYFLEENSKLQHKNNEIRGKIRSTILSEANDVSIAFNPYVSHTMFEAASEWNKHQEEELYKGIVADIAEKAVTCHHIEKRELRDYLVSYVKQYRNYSTNDIINIFICITQGFLTVFSGLPGTGKTSVCNIIGNSLGLTDFGGDKINYNRFVPVSVEKGWSSKKDLIGYYNPLTQKYDKSNRKLYDSLMILNEEKDNSMFPYLVLLDEANLSPMEYYWADFMQLADKSDNSGSYINIGLEDDIYIPDTLRFVATINNDQTTETLSPRLIDRAWIIKLPDCDIKEEIPRPAKKILWKDLYDAFGTVTESRINCQPLLGQIFELFQSFGMAVSPRVRLSMIRYITTAREVMEGANGVNSECIAVDYAVMQKLLPKINGHINLYDEFFDKLIYICNENRLDMTRDALEEMKNNSTRNMGYCQYLS